MDDTRPLSQVYGQPARLQIIETALAAPDRTYNVGELADAAGVDESTVHEHKEFLVDLGILDTVSLGAIDGYTLADNSEIAEIGQRWREIHRERLERIEDQTVSAIEGFYG